MLHMYTDLRLSSFFTFNSSDVILLDIRTLSKALDPYNALLDVHGILELCPNCVHDNTFIVCFSHFQI